ncbi:Serine/threonine-protein phosphatase 2A 55 kDa regulatory subunit B [Aphelenchoides fujianensis]|nr:Serine/threonine-protein phosphatase 2A 55 kDa regulatory subunit B [Aphelenchoides fujianensis]
MEYDRDPSGQEDAMDVDVDVEEHQIEWRPTQRKTNNGAMDDGVEAEITSVEFSEDGEMLAIGDKNGRISIFRRDHDFNSSGARTCVYDVYSTFQSHEPEFDYLKSLEIEEKINQVKWMKKKNAANFILSTNDKTIKLWKIFGAREAVTRRKNDRLVLPQLEPMELVVEASPRRVYGNAHTYHVNSISVNPDQETFISADDLRINLWNHEVTRESFTIVDMKPVNMEELTEVITSAEFHPLEGHLFAFSSSKGNLFEEKEDPNARSFFSEIISSVSDVKFSHSGRYILTRDYLSVNIWDLNMSDRPCEQYNVHEYLRNKLCMLYEDDSIFDKFECCWSGDDRQVLFSIVHLLFSSVSACSHILTGSYNNFFRTFKRNSPLESTYEAGPDFFRQPPNPQAAGPSCKKRKEDIVVDHLDFSKKILHCAWHPTADIVALGGREVLYVYESTNQLLNERRLTRDFPPFSPSNILFLP